MDVKKEAKAQNKHTSQEVVERFLEQLEALDLDAALDMMSEDCVYKNMPFHTANGKQGIGRDLRAMMSKVSGFEVEMLHIASEGKSVMTERIDTIATKRVSVEVELMGVFIVNQDGLISEWRDYFDWASTGGRFIKNALYGVFSGRRE